MIGLSLACRNGKLNAVRGAIDAGNGPARLRFYSGVRPAAGGQETQLLAEAVLAFPCAPPAHEGRLAFHAIETAGPAPVGGRAKWARIVTAAGEFVMDLSAGGKGSGADIQLDVKDGEIVEGTRVRVPSFVLTEMDS